MKEFVEKLPYLAPTIKVVPFKVERGFQDSGTQLSQGYYTGQKHTVNEVEMMMFQMGNTNGAAQNQLSYFGNTTNSTNWNDGFWNY